MIDREKVINGLKCCGSKGMSTCASEKCPYYPDKYEWDECTSQLANDALELLKEREPVIVLNICFQFSCYSGNCPSCGKMLNTICDKHYCGECGRAVKWE